MEKLMRSIIEVPLNNLRVDRTPLNPKVFMYATAMMQGAVFPPIRVARRGCGSWEIRDGRHRVAAARLMARGKIRARCADGQLRRRRDNP